MSALPISEDSKYTAPPSFGAVLFTKVQSSTRPFGPIHTIAPPSPPFPSEDLFSPVARLLVKLEPVITPFSPFQKTAPPALKAVLFKNVEFSIVPFVAN